MRDCRVVVLSMDHPNFTRVCLEYIRKYSNQDLKVAVIDNGSSPDNLSELEKICKRFRVLLMPQGKNIGIAPALNLGIKWCEDDDFCFVSNDIVVGYNWLERLRAGGYKYKEIGGFCPYIAPEATFDPIAGERFRNNYKANYQGRFRVEPTYKELIDTLDEIHMGDFNSFTKDWTESRIVTPPWWEWFSMVMYIKRDTINKIGLFDEQFVPTHWEDMDYMVRMNNADLFRISVADSYCFHWGQITTRQAFNDYNHANMELAKDNGKKFNAKWKIFREDGNKYEPMVPGKYQPWPVSDVLNNRPYDKWWLREPEKYPEIYQINRG